VKGLSLTCAVVDGLARLHVHGSETLTVFDCWNRDDQEVEAELVMFSGSEIAHRFPLADPTGALAEILGPLHFRAKPHLQEAA
jgi:hypothetical protein